MFNIHKKSKKIFKLASKALIKCKCVKVDQITQNKGLSKPFKFKLQNLLKHFTSLDIDQLLGNRVLDLIVSKSNSFLGTEIIQESMSYQDFLQYEGPLTLYLAQVPIDVECPKALGDKGKVYLWCSKGYTDSGWHYDSFENYLGVVEGVKIVYLKESCNWKCFEPVYSDDYNHIRGGQFMKGKFVVLLKDEMLYIPQGMLHRVVSYDMTTGLNVWMEGINDSIIKPSHYQLRYIMNELVQQDLKLTLRKWSQRRLKKINPVSYVEQIRKNEYALSIRQQSRTISRKPINYDLSILICLLFKLECEKMVLFLQQLMKFMDITYLINLQTELQCMMAIKLDEYSQEIQNIQQREDFYQELIPYLQFTESLKLNQKQMTMKIAYQNVLQHLP